MPIIGFITKDNKEVLFKDIWKNPYESMIRFGMTIPTLRAIADQRPKDRPPSVTECLKDTCEAYLTRTLDFFINPDDHAFSLSGTMHHLKLEHHANQDKAETQWKGLDMTGITDYLEGLDVIDYKNWGSYKAKLSFGLEAVGKKDDPSGAIYMKSGKWGRAGTPKQINIWARNPDKADMKEVELQQNMYRIFIEEETKQEIHKLWVQVTIRDGGLEVAIKRGIDRNIYLEPVQMLPDQDVITYFTTMRNALNEALEKKKLPPKCRDKNDWGFSYTWNGIKCKRFCDVRHLCPYNQ